MGSPSKAARDLAEVRMAAEFNSKLEAVAGSYGVRLFSIDFRNGENFFRGKLEFEDVIDTLNVRPPFMIIHTERLKGPPFEKGRSVSGYVLVSIKVAGEWEQDRADIDFEAWGDCMEDVMCSIWDVQRPLQNSRAHWTGEMNCTAGPLLKAADNWAQVLTFELTFRVHA